MQTLEHTHSVFRPVSWILHCLISKEAQNVSDSEWTLVSLNKPAAKVDQVFRCVVPWQVGKGREKGQTRMK